MKKRIIENSDQYYGILSAQGVNSGFVSLISELHVVVSSNRSALGIHPYELVRLLLIQESKNPTFVGCLLLERAGSRTLNLAIKSRLLYQLSYAPSNICLFQRPKFRL